MRVGVGAATLRDVPNRAALAAEAAALVDVPRVAAIVREVPRWYAAAGRAVPWRFSRDPYAILVAELMSQQTQVGRVATAWPAFLSSFPTVEALAAAPTAEVLTAWRGMGYNRRALRLQEAARRIVDEHDGVVPADVAALETLPGVGPYTARAVAAFAYDLPAAPVDTNIARVLARAVAGAPLTRPAVQAVADALLPAEDPAMWNHALMDLGATHCTARDPRCGDCPLLPNCAWRQTGGPDPIEGSALRPRPQGRFVDSDRYHRGRLVDALRAAPLGSSQVRECLGGLDEARRRRIVDGLRADGLVEDRGDGLGLVGDPRRVPDPGRGQR